MLKAYPESSFNTLLVSSYWCVYFSMWWQKYKVGLKLPMSLLQFMLTGSPGYSKAKPGKKVMPVYSPLPPEPRLSWEEQVSVFLRDVSVRCLCKEEKMDFLHVLREYLHQRKLTVPLGEGGQWCLLMLPLKQSPMTKSLQTAEVTDAVKLLGWFWELVSLYCHQCWQGPHHTGTVYTSWIQIPSKILPVIFANVPAQLLPAVNHSVVIWWKGQRNKHCTCFWLLWTWGYRPDTCWHLHNKCRLQRTPQATATQTIEWW